MDSYHITGGHKLEGVHTVSGAKNAVLPILAATLVSGKEAEITGCPHLSDVYAMLNILRYLGCTASFENGVIYVDSSGVNTFVIPESMMREMRSSIFIMGPMLAKYGEITLSYPGGCEIGNRPINIHLDALRKMGVNVVEKDDMLICSTDGLIGTSLKLDFPSVGATENIMIAATAATGETEIINAAQEPEIVDLQNFLNSMGGEVIGAGTDTIKIKGHTQWHETSFKIMPDRIEAGTVMAAAAVTGGHVLLKNARPQYMYNVIEAFKSAGCIIKEGTSEIELNAPMRLQPVNNITTRPYPGFPTDMQPQFVTMMTLADGQSNVTETIFENRFRFTEELIKMGAIIDIEDCVLKITGKQKLMGTQLTARDLRGGAALVIGAVAAEGNSIVNSVSHIDRGYEKLENILNNIGAKIIRVTER